MLTFIDGEPLKAGLLLRGSTVINVVKLNKKHKSSMGGQTDRTNGIT